MNEEKIMFALLNLVLSLGITFMAFCRINALPPQSPIRVIAPYAMVLTSGLVSASQPWYGNWPSAGHLFCIAAFFAYFLSTKNKSGKAS